MFSIRGNKGFQMTFENGYTVSVQFGEHNYCDNYSLKISAIDVSDCKNAETALIDPDGKFVRYLHKEVQEDMTPEMVLDLMNHARDLPKYEKQKYC
jgi:hypothetical protein